MIPIWLAPTPGPFFSAALPLLLGAALPDPVGRIDGRVPLPPGGSPGPCRAYLVEAFPGDEAALRPLVESQIRHEEALAYVEVAPVGARGRFRFHSVPTGRWRVWVGSSSTWYRPSEVVRVDEGSTAYVAASAPERLAPQHRLTVVLEHEGDCYRGSLRYWLEDDPLEWGRDRRIGADGTLEVLTPEAGGRLDLLAWCEHGHGWLDGVEAGSTVRVPIRPRRVEDLAIEFVGPSEAELERLEVELLLEGSGRRRFLDWGHSPSDSGVYEVELPSVPFYLELDGDGRRSTHGPYSPDEVGSHLRLPMPPGAVADEVSRGQIVRGGSPLAGVRVTLDVSSHAPFDPYALALDEIGVAQPRTTRWRRSVSSTDSNGMFALPSLGRGEGWLSVRTGALERVEVGRVRADPGGGALRVDVDRPVDEPFGTLVGRVGEGGVREARLALVSDDGQSWLSGVGADGRVRVADLRPGTWWAVARRGESLWWKRPRVGALKPEWEHFPSGWGEEGVELLFERVRVTSGEEVRLVLPGDRPPACHLSGVVRLGGERWKCNQKKYNRPLCGFGAPMVVRGWFAGLRPAGAPIEAAVWSPVSPDGELSLAAHEPGEYQLLLSLDVDPCASYLRKEEKLLLARDVTLWPGSRHIDLDLAVGALDLRFPLRDPSRGEGRFFLLLERPDGLRGAIALARPTDRNERVLPRIPAGPARVLRALPDGRTELVRHVVVPANGAVVVDLP